MKEALKAPVMVGDDEKELELIFDEDDVMDCLLDNKLIFMGNFEGNFEDLFARALQLWSNKYHIQTKEGEEE